MQFVREEDGVKLGLSSSMIIGGSLLGLFKYWKSREFQSTYKLFIEADENQSQKSAALLKKVKEGKPTPVKIERVIPHFPQIANNYIFVQRGKNDEYMTAEIPSFNVVDRSHIDRYMKFVIDCNRTLLNKSLATPVIHHAQVVQANNISNRLKSRQNFYLSSAAEIGLVGVLSFCHDDGQYHIEAKIIGQSIQRIRQWVESEDLQNKVLIGVGVAIAVAGLLWLGKSVYDIDERRRASNRLNKSMQGSSISRF